jgi:hypothetical protein
MRDNISPSEDANGNALQIVSNRNNGTIDADNRNADRTWATHNRKGRRATVGPIEVATQVVR